MGTSTAVLAARCKRLQGPVAMASKLSEWVVHNSYASRDLCRKDCVEHPLRDMSAVRQLRCLQIKVSRWSGPMPVSIKWLEVWGILSTACSKEEKKNFLDKFHASTIGCPMISSLPPRMFEDPELAKHADGLSMLAQDLSSKRSVAFTMESAIGADKTSKIEKTSHAPQLHANIPEELLDALTFELMVLPMLLPSGHYVDRSTVDKLAAADAVYGRPPTDPFTGICMRTVCYDGILIYVWLVGVAFSASCQPEFSVHLKSQLDQYLSSYAARPAQESTLASGRTLGSCSQIQLHRTRQRKGQRILQPALLFIYAELEALQLQTACVV